MATDKAGTRFTSGTTSTGPLSGRTILVTGATAGLGRHLAVRLAAGGARIVASGRDAARAKELQDETGADVLLADLAELRQVDRLADDILERYDRLDAVVNNAGIGGGPPGSGRELSADGIELRFAVNHLAGYHLTRRLLPVLADSAPARVVNVASAGQQAIDFADSMLERGYSGMRAYCQSKLAQIMFTFDLAEELRDRRVEVNALHPATFMDTTMVRESGVGPLSTVEDGAEAVLPLVTGRDGVTGRYYDRLAESRADPQAYDLEARRRLRRLSDDLIARALGPER